MTIGYQWLPMAIGHNWIINYDLPFGYSVGMWSALEYYPEYYNVLLQSDVRWRSRSLDSSISFPRIFLEELTFDTSVILYCKCKKLVVDQMIRNSFEFRMDLRKVYRKFCKLNHPFKVSETFGESPWIDLFKKLSNSNGCQSSKLNPLYRTHSNQINPWTLRS